MSSRRNNVDRPLDATNKLRVPPHSVDAEQAVIGAMMLGAAISDEVVQRLAETDFYRHDHRLMWRAMLDLYEHERPIDALTVGEWLENRELLDEAGGLAYIGALAKDSPGPSNLLAYADVVRERSQLRNVIRVGNELAQAGFQPEGRTAAEIVDLAGAQVIALAETARAGGPVPLKQLQREWVERMDRRMNNQGQLQGISTGLLDLDRRTQGLHRTDVVIVAGRPSMGKTAFAMNIAMAVAEQLHPVAVFSMEMSGGQLMDRMVSALTGVDHEKIRTANLDPDEWAKVTVAMERLSRVNMHIDESGALSPVQLRARCRQLQRTQGKLGAIVVDYIQLMQVPGSKENRTQEVSEISRNLKALAKELDTTVIALSQLNRGLEGRPDKRPIMSDLRESGSIEQDADVIMFLYRDEVYNPNTVSAGIAEVIIAKQRNGPLGKVLTQFQGSRARFVSLAGEDQERYWDEVNARREQRNRKPAPRRRGMDTDTDGDI